jgi:lysophospholipase L1-like esterase
VFCVVAIGMACLAAASATFGAAKATPQRPVFRLPQSYYLALGDSMAYGFQPTKKPGAPPAVFDTGYVDVFAARLRKLSPKIRVVNYGCPGESTMTFSRGGCPGFADGFKLHDPFSGPQLRAAESFLRAHPGQVSPITVTLWGGDLPLPLSRNAKQAPKAIASFGSRFSSVLEQLRAAAPTAEIIVTGAWNLEADRLVRAEPLYRSLDVVIRRAAAASRARVANMFAALNGTGGVEAQKARLCRLTFYCSKQDPHPTDAGYRSMADAFTAASGYPRKP